MAYLRRKSLMDGKWRIENGRIRTAEPPEPVPWDLVGFKESENMFSGYTINLKNGNWRRITDPNAGHSGAAAFLPNPALEINIDDLEGANRAEVLMDIWGGHAGTSGGQIKWSASGGSISENPEIIIDPVNPMNVKEIHVIGKYYGYDENGDGLNFDWHRAYHGEIYRKGRPNLVLQ